MQEALKKVTNGTAESVEKSVTLCLRSRLIHLSGFWDWETNAAAIYCSDVMSFPEDFFGTSGIIHPDDLPKLVGALSIMEEKEVPQLSFRIITTYGEVKTISGKRVSLTDEKKQLLEPLPGKELWEEALQNLAIQKEIDFLQLRKELTDISEGLHSIGSWFINKSTGEAWYSDNVFRIYNLAPQSVNTHSNIFNRFIHLEDRIAVSDAFEKAYNNETPLHIEFRILLPEGEVKYVQQITKWLFNVKGQLVLAGIIRDVTDERAVANELLAAQSVTLLHQRVLKFSEQQTASGFWYINLVTRKTSFSDNYYRIYGFKQSHLPNYNSFLNLIHPDDRNNVRQVMEKMYNEHVLEEVEFRIVRPDGRIRQLRQTGKAFISPGKELFMIGLVQDVTVQKDLEKKIEELNESMALNKAAMEMSENIADISSIVWLQDGYMQWSNGFYRLLGYRPGSIEPLPRYLYKSIYPSDLKTFKDAEALVTSQQPHDDIVIRFVSKLGLRQVKISFRQVNVGKEVVIGLVHNISKQSQLQEEYANNHLFVELMADSVKDVIIFTNIDHTITYWNKAAEEKTNIAKENALHHNLFDVLPCLNEEAFTGQIYLALKGDEVHTRKASNVYMRKPHDYWLYPLKNNEGEVTGVLHVVHDVSRQLELQQQLSERLNFIESLVESSIDRIVVLDSFMNYLYWNKKAEEYYAVKKEKVLGKNILEIFPLFRNEPTYQQFRMVLRGDTVYLPPVEDEHTGEYFETYLIPVKNEENAVTSVLWIVHDLSSEYQLTKERRQTTNLLHGTMNATKDMIQVLEAVRDNYGEIIDFKWMLLNDEAQRWIGDVMGESLIEHQQDLLGKDLFDAIKKVVETGTSSQTESYYAHGQLNGWFYQSVTKLNDGVVITMSDITKRKEAEQEILRLKDEIVERTQNKYYTLFETIADGFSIIELVVDNNGKAVDFIYIETNPSFVKQLGVDWKGNLTSELFSDKKDFLLEKYEYVAKTGKPVHLEYCVHSLNDQWFQASVSRISEEGSKQLGIVFRNISGLKKAEEDLRKSEEQLRQLNSSLEQQVEERTKEIQKQLALLRYTEYLAQSGSWEYDIEGGHFSWSEGMYKLFGLPQQMNVRPETYLDFATEEDRAIAKKIISRLKKKHDPFEEIIHIKRNNDVRTLKVKGSVVHDVEGKAKKMIGVDIDVTNIQQAEEKLKESRHWLEQTAKVSPDSIVIYDLFKKEPVYLNNCLGDWTGKTTEELTEMGIEGRLQLVHKEDRLKLLHFNEIMNTANDDEIRTIEYRITNKDEKLMWVKNRSKIFQKEENGKVTHILSILQDVTAEVQLKEELQRRTAYAESIIDSSIDRIAVYDKELHIIAWNKRSEIVTGRRRENLLGKKLFEAFPKLMQDEEIVKAHRDALKGNYVTLPAKRGIYTNNYYERFYIPLKNERGETYAIVNVMHDVSELTHRNQELSELNKTLEQKNKELEQKNEEIMNFAFVSSHDMKEPLRKVHTFANWLAEQEMPQLSPKGQIALEKMNAAVRRMEMLIDDILVLTKIHSDTNKEEHIDLNKMLRSVMHEMSEEMETSKAQITIDELPLIKGNSNQIFYLFKNLLSNAIKFQKPETIPQIKITAEIVNGEEADAAEPDAEYGKISFIDNGIGFETKYAKKIFQVFQRLNGKHEFEGTGIGLAICKKIMENHNGWITVESTPGKGSVFSCYFPL